ncbi:MAG: bifunctional hydroxymethylpyrimidine kinase/phosphomethylpyrimidine kinase [Halobacteria archaeon]
MKSKSAAIPRVLAIAGSDSGGGAGIQADLKTFAALGVFGMSAVTTVTAQDTRRVAAVHGVPPAVVRAQIRAVVEDIGVDAVKTGMLHTAPVIEAVAGELRRIRAPVVVDPVMVAKSGDSLLQEEARESLIREILPLAAVLTPNIPEAEALAGRRVRTLEQARAAARSIARLGPGAVVVKGGHLRTPDAVDVLFHRGKTRLYPAPREATLATHGTGCAFASAIAAELAKGAAVPDAVAVAKEFVTLAVRAGLPLGSGHGPANPAAWLHREAERGRVLREVSLAARLLEAEPLAASLAPEAQISVVMALPWASSVEEVAGIPGRIVKMGRKARGVKASGWPEFGASHHVATAVLTAMRSDPRMRAGMNLRMGDDVVRAARALGLSVSTYDRRSEPAEVKRVENRTIAWGTEEAIRNHGGRVPDLFYHRGDWGKEPMAVLLGETATGVASAAVRIAKSLARD